MEDKPIILSIKETEEKILSVVNEAGLPAFFLRYIFDRIEKDLILIEQNEIAIANKKATVQDTKTKKED